MESIQLSAFYRSINHWPKSARDFSSLFESLSLLVPATFMAIYIPGADQEKSEGILEIRRSQNDHDFSGQARGLKETEELVRKLIFQSEPIKSVQSAGSLFKQVQLSNALSHGAYFGIAPVAIEIMGARQNRAWLIAGANKAFSKMDEVLLLSVAQRLAELSEIDRLEQEIQLRSRFLSIASHELKTPLTSIYGMLQLQERMYRSRKDGAPPLDPIQQMDYLKRSIRQVERLNELIDGLLDISRIQNGRFMIEQSDVDVGAILQEVISDRLELVAQEAGVRLQVEAPASLSGWADPVRVEELVSNLVMNAIRFSPEGGVVWIKLRAEQDLFRLTIRDQGPSVPAEDRERIFLPFERAQRTARLGGLGLGLFISQQIARLHGGDVKLIESIPGKGNIFEATFPSRSAGTLSA